MFDHPAVIAVVIPMTIALVSGGLAGTLGQRPAATHLLGLGGCAGLLTAYFMLFGWPEAMPRTATQKLGYIAIAGLAAGIAIDMARQPVAAMRMAVLLPVAAVAWIVTPQFLRYVSDASRGVPDWGPILVAMLLAVAVLWRLTQPESGLRDGRLAQLVAACFGLGGICILGSAASLGLLAFAAGAAGAGIAVWNLGRRRAAIGCGLLLALGSVFAGLAIQAALFTTAAPIALLILLLCFVSDLVPVLRPMATPETGFRILTSAPPYVVAAVSVGIALLQGGMGGGY